MISVPLDLVYKIAQEAHTMGRLYEKTLSTVNPSLEYENVIRMVDNFVNDR